VEFLGPGGEVRGRANAATQRAEYERHCAEQGLELRDLRA
jgi:2,4'-dihydroxyacetophenone dioxygenase